MSNTLTEGKRRPAAGYHPDSMMFETVAFAKRVARQRRLNEIAKASRRRNRR